MKNLTHTADFLSKSLEELGFVIMSKTSGKGLPLVAFRFATPAEGGKERHYDEFSLAHTLRSRGWVVPAYTMAPHTEQLKMLRVVVREDFSKSRCDMLVHDIKLVCGLLDETDRESVKKQEEYIKRHLTSAGRRNRNSKSHGNNSKAYKVGGSSHADVEYSLILNRMRSTRCKERRARRMPFVKIRCRNEMSHSSKIMTELS